MTRGHYISPCQSTQVTLSDTKCSGFLSGDIYALRVLHKFMKERNITADLASRQELLPEKQLLFRD